MSIIHDALTRVRKGSSFLQIQMWKSGCQLAAKIQMLAEEAILYTVFGPSLFHGNKKRKTQLRLFSLTLLWRLPGTLCSVRQAEPIEGDFLCSTAAEPGAAEGHDEEGWAGNQWQSDWNVEETGGSCATTACPRGARETEIPARRGEDRQEAMVSTSHLLRL